MTQKQNHNHVIMLWARELRLHVRAAPPSGPRRPQGEPGSSSNPGPSTFPPCFIPDARLKKSPSSSSSWERWYNLHQSQKAQLFTSAWPQCPRFDQEETSNWQLQPSLKRGNKSHISSLGIGSRWASSPHLESQRVPHLKAEVPEIRTHTKTWELQTSKPGVNSNTILQTDVKDSGVKGNSGGFMYFQCHVKVS